MNNILGKYEKAKIIGVRASQISMGAPSTVNTAGLTDPIDIAEKEYDEDKIPFLIKRKSPNDKVEIVRLSDLRKLDLKN